MKFIWTRITTEGVWNRVNDQDIVIEKDPGVLQGQMTIEFISHVKDLTHAIDTVQGPDTVFSKTDKPMGK